MVENNNVVQSVAAAISTFSAELSFTCFKCPRISVFSRSYRYPKLKPNEIILILKFKCKF